MKLITNSDHDFVQKKYFFFLVFFLVKLSFQIAKTFKYKAETNKVESCGNSFRRNNIEKCA